MQQSYRPNAVKMFSNCIVRCLSNAFKVLVNWFDFETISTHRYKKMLNENPAFMTWAEYLDDDRVIFIPFNYPKDRHYLCAMLYESAYYPENGKGRTGCYKLRIFNSIQGMSLEHDKDIAQSLTAWCHTLGLDLDSVPIVDVTAKMPIPFQQRENKNLCAIHVAVRAVS